MAQFVDRSLLFLKGVGYLDKVKELGLISRPNYDQVITVINSFIASNNEGYQKDIEEMGILASVFTETFYHTNTLKSDVLLDIRFYSENLLRILNYLYNDSVNSLDYFTECSEGLKTHDIDGIYKEMVDTAGEKQEMEIVMLKGKLFYSLIVTIIENNNSREYHISV